MREQEQDNVDDDASEERDEVVLNHPPAETDSIIEPLEDCRLLSAVGSSISTPVSIDLAQREGTLQHVLEELSPEGINQGRLYPSLDRMVESRLISK